MQVFHDDAPGLAYDGIHWADPRAVLAALDSVVRPKAPRERPIEIELTPIPAVPTADTDKFPDQVDVV